MPRSWSPDGRWLAGHFRSDAGERGLALHSFESGELTELLPYGSYAVWLADSRHLVFQAGSYLESRLMMVDRETGESHVLFAPTDAGAMYPSISRDNRTLYFTRSTKESDIWLATLQETS